jgi:hypothetical protein
MESMRVIFALGCLAICAFNAQADQETGNDLLKYCTSADKFQRGYCFGKISEWANAQNDGYTAGLYEGVSSEARQIDPKISNDGLVHQVASVSKKLKQEGKAWAVCIPDQATNQQMRDVVVKWLNNNPEERANSIAYVMNKAFIGAFGYPCTQ